MIALPRFMRRLKFSSQIDLIGMIALSVDGFMREDDDYDEDRYPSYSDFILSRYVNIMPSFVGITGESPQGMDLDDCVFRFQLKEVPESSYLVGNYTKYLRYAEFRAGLAKFLSANCPGFNSLPKS